MGNEAIPSTHPRAQSLNIRHALIQGVKDGITADSGLIAHGRGEAFDYLLGERTHDFAEKAIIASAAALFTAKHPVISVNGNTAILCPKEMVEFSNMSSVPLEINLFYRTSGRIEKIADVLRKHGAKYVLGVNEEEQVELDGFDSYRRIVDRNGIEKADVVVVPLEDGDRTENLVRMGKTVVTIDLNPLSRTSIAANITVVDNILRFFPLLKKHYLSMTPERAKKILDEYDNKQVLQASLEAISTLWRDELVRKYDLFHQ